MKFINATILNRLLVCLGLLFLSAYFPIKALALSNDPQQHFTSASTSNWAISSCGLGTYTLSLNNTLPDTVVSGESAQNGIVDTASTYTGSCAVTVTYTDPSPSTGGTQNYIKVDVYTKTVGRAFAISATDGATTVTASAGSQNILTACASAPASQTNTNPGNSWETIFLNTSSLGNITQV
ncbi:MAG TPA: hypothetical protein VN963_03815, partial [bacterium]|nr:hypothetical protein [bacterium]